MFVSEENHVFAFYKMILTKYKSVRRRIRVLEKLSLGLQNRLHLHQAEIQSLS